MASGLENTASAFAAGASSQTGQNLTDNAAHLTEQAVRAGAASLGLKTPALWQAAQAAGKMVWEQARAQAIDETDLSEEEKAARRKVEEVRAALTSDPEIKRQKLRIAQWFKEIRDWREQADKKIRRLRAQKAQVKLKIDEHAPLRVEDAYKQWDSAAMLWEEEFAFFERLYATPKMLRFYVNWTQSHQSRLPMMHRIHEARRALPAQK